MMDKCRTKLGTMQIIDKKSHGTVTDRNLEGWLSFASDQDVGGRMSPAKQILRQSVAGQFELTHYRQSARLTGRVQRLPVSQPPLSRLRLVSWETQMQAALPETAMISRGRRIHPAL